MLTRLERLEIIPIVEHCNSEFSQLPQQDASNGELVSIDGRKVIQFYEFTNTYLESFNCVYQVPYLFCKNGEPWTTANLYLYRLAKESLQNNKPNDHLRRVAWALLEYKVFCENNNLDIYDFSSLRPIGRPTYRFFRHLLDNCNIQGITLNRKTKYVYEFYKYISDIGKHNIDIRKVDITKSVKVSINTKYGYIEKDVEKRSQSVPVCSSSSTVKVGFVRDEGEELRPLNNEEYLALIDGINQFGFKTDQKLILFLALFTGERKQTILTLRVSHLEQFNEASLKEGGVYILNVNTRNGADTKFNKPHTLYIPSFIVDKLRMWVESETYLKRVAKFRSLYGDIFSEKDMYIFLSREGNCHYMAKSDPRYIKCRTRPAGGNTKSISDRLIKLSNGKIPSNYTFHWLRATYALKLYQSFAPLLESGELRIGDDITVIQKRLHHTHRETTEGYLKLFTTLDERLFAQREYERKLFGDSDNDFTKDAINAF
ncbi:site-specific integrase [Pseudoalteromonas ostreae]|uniref:site-specific integrase n=1 Tax=Pseudoalteromonas ostreae TaxID=2774154 RepID=UPI001B39B9BF|nr:site-specific integrase [Pseudoalteromonas ostreae]